MTTVPCLIVQRLASIVHAAVVGGFYQHDRRFGFNISGSPRCGGRGYYPGSWLLPYRSGGQITMAIMGFILLAVLSAASFGAWSDNATSRQCGAAVLLCHMAERGIIDLTRTWRHGISAACPGTNKSVLRWSRRGSIPYSRKLQEFLNTLPGNYVKPDGWPGDKTSEAFHKISGYCLPGDPGHRVVAAVTERLMVAG